MGAVGLFVGEHGLAGGAPEWYKIKDNLEGSEFNDGGERGVIFHEAFGYHSSLQ
jgi:hypothetical protein